MSGVGTALHSVNEDKSVAETMGSIAMSMCGSLFLQGILTGLDARVGNLNTTLLEQKLLCGKMGYGATQMGITGLIRVTSNAWRNKDGILNLIFG